jgi:tetratricopeptide (TPR) repeat protein
MDKKVESFINLIDKLKEGRGIESFGDHIFVVDIPEKKLINAKKALKVPEDQTVLIMFDETAFGSAKEAVLFTDWGIYYKVYSSFWSFSWDLLFKSFYYLDIKNKWPVLVASINDQETKKEIILPVSTPDNKIFLSILYSAIAILGSPDEMEINSFDELAQFYKNRNKKDNDEKTKANGAPKDDKKLNEVNAKQDTATPEAIDPVVEKMIKKKYDNFIKYFNKGMDYNDKKNHEQAIIWLSKALNEYNEEMNKPDQLALAHLLFAGSRFAVYYENFEKYIMDYGFDRKAFFSVIDDIKKAIEYNPKEAELYYEIGSLFDYLSIFKNDEKEQVVFDYTLKYYDKAIELDQDNARYKESRQDFIDINMDCYKKHLADNETNLANKNADPLINVNENKEKAKDAPQDDIKPVEIHPIEINKRIILVCDKTNNNIDVAASLLNLLKLSCTDEPELRTYAEYKTISFEAELLGEEQEFSAIFFMTPATPSMVNVTWKYNKDGIRYGWNDKKAVIFAENVAYNNEENKKILAKYGGKSIQEAFARMFYHEEIQKFLCEEA